MCVEQSEMYLFWFLGIVDSHWGISVPSPAHFLPCPATPSASQGSMSNTEVSSMLCVPLNTNLISLNPNPRDSKRIMKTAFSTRGNSAPRPHHLAESGVIFGCHNWVGGAALLASTGYCPGRLLKSCNTQDSPYKEPASPKYPLQCSCRENPMNREACRLQSTGSQDTVEWLLSTHVYQCQGLRKPALPKRGNSTLSSTQGKYEGLPGGSRWWKAWECWSQGSACPQGSPPAWTPAPRSTA